MDRRASAAPSSPPAPEPIWLLRAAARPVVTGTARRSGTGIARRGAQADCIPLGHGLVRTGVHGGGVVSVVVGARAAIADAVAGILIVVDPEMVFSPFRRNSDSRYLHVMAVVGRIVLGTALIMCAKISRCPTTLLLIGWTSIVAALVLGFMGRTNFKRLMSWALNLSPVFMRAGGWIAVLFGGFLVYAVV